MNWGRFVCIAGLVGLVFGLAPSTSWAQLKIGYIDPQKILESYKPYLDADKEFKRYEEELSREISKQQNELAKMQETYERQALLLSDKRKQEEQQAILKKRQDLERFVAEATDPQRGRLAQKNVALSEPIFKKVNEMVKRVAEDSGYDFVLNTAALAYANEAHNLTEKVLEALNKDLEASEAESGQ